PDPLAGVPAGLPALARAQHLGEKARQLGLDWPDITGVLAKLREEQVELEAAVAAGDRTAAACELGDVLLTLTSVARHLDVPAEMALRDAADRFVARARRVEAGARPRGAGARGLPRCRRRNSAAPKTDRLAHSVPDSCATSAPPPAA